MRQVMVKPDRTVRITEPVCCAALAGPQISLEQAEDTAALFKALADPTRVRLVNMLANSPEAVCVCDLNAHFDLGQPTLSHHLKKLVTAGLLKREQRGTWAYYSLRSDSLKQLADVTKPRRRQR
jgi:ArsR family transcriptional regulator, arsenate/arsenite/antimonite-responsive transcriptional repressor